mmetsp:Transcript_56837/g.169178  ORF Transcript_56837/g.169178 Transcript_56837/m.169178 type:complete len:234 (-) Transcript_56837:9-710(-)
MEPKAEPRRVGRFLSATRLSSRGCTMPRPTPFRARPRKTTSKDQATAHKPRPAAQKSMPSHMSRGLGSNSPRKPQGKAKSAAAQPLVVESRLSEVWETPKCTWNSLKKIGKMEASMVHATLQRHNSTNSAHCRPAERVSSQPSSGSSSLAHNFEAFGETSVASAGAGHSGLPAGVAAGAGHSGLSVGASAGAGPGHSGLSVRVAAGARHSGLSAGIGSILAERLGRSPRDRRA